MRKGKLHATTAAIGIAVACAQPAWGQSQGSTSGTESTTTATTNETIIVTGSRIRRPNLESTVPVTTVQGEEFFETGQVAIGDVLNELPALRSTFSQSNSTRFLGTAGLNLLDLRGLGTQRTLVLVNGRRHVGSDILSNGVSPDTNTFPTDLVERVDIVTGGNSAVYGSDAIAGVVNFILKKDFQGFQIRTQGGVSKYKDAGSFFVSGTAGTNFADGRGNIALNVEYARQAQYFANTRSHLRSQDGFIVVDTDPAGATNGSDGKPDRLFFRDIRSATLNNTGLVRFGGTAAMNCGTDGIGGFFNCPYIFQTDGTLVPMTGQRVGIGPNGNFIGGNGEGFRTGNQLQVSPQLNRYNVNLMGHFSVSDAFEPFFEAKYARTEVLGTGSSGPAFITGTTLGDAREAPRLSNPFLSAQARALITQQLTTQNGAAPSPNARFSLRENMYDLGARTEESTRETYRGVIGVRGNFNDDWNYEVSANYGEFKEKTKVLGNLNIQRFLLAMDAVRDTSGNIVCNAKINPAAAIPYVDGSDANGNDPILNADVAACIPVNPFGGQFTDAQRNYLLTNTTSVGKITQFVLGGFVSGDSSQLFELPGGPVGFVLGAEYRRETNYFKADPFVEKGYTFYNAIPTFTSPAFEVKEAYGEIRLPIIADSFIHELTLSGAGRIADYKGATGTVYSYSGGIDFAPIKDIRFRANYARAVRAPNLSELYSAPGQNFAPAFVDPCSLRNIGTGSSTRAANCQAAGVPANYDFVYSQSLEIVSGGNAELKAETSDSYTVGVVVQPRFVPGLALSVDYYDITVNKVISAVAAQTIVNQCYDQPTLNNVFCSLFTRAGAGGGPKGEIPFQILEGSLLQSSLNFAKMKARGIDAELSYRGEIGNIGTLTSRLTYTHVLQRDNFLNPAEPQRANRILLELGDPKDEFSWKNSLKVGKVTFGYDLRYIGKQVLNAYEDTFSLQGRPPENADYADRRYYPSVFYHDVRVALDVNEKFNIYGGIENIANKAPPLGLTGIGAGSGIYDPRGRFFYAGVSAKF